MAFDDSIKYSASEYDMAKQNYLSILASGRLKTTIVDVLSKIGLHIEMNYPEISAMLSARVKNKNSLFHNIDLSEAHGRVPDIYDILGIKVTINNFDADAILENPYNSSVFTAITMYKSSLRDLENFEKKYASVLSEDFAPLDESQSKLIELANYTYNSRLQMVSLQKDQVCYEIGKYLLDTIANDISLSNKLGLESPFRRKTFNKGYFAEHITFKCSYLPNTYLELQTLSKDKEKSSRVGISAHYSMPNKETPILTPVLDADDDAFKKLDYFMSFVPDYFVYKSHGDVHILTPSECFLAYYIDTPGKKYIDDYLKLFDMNKAREY